jgi:hypothetical protein
MYYIWRWVEIMIAWILVHYNMTVIDCDIDWDRDVKINIVIEKETTIDSRSMEKAKVVSLLTYSSNTFFSCIFWKIITTLTKKLFERTF